MVLFLSDVAGSEILVILLFVLIFFGPKSIPGIARTFGKTIRQIRDASDELQNEIRKSGLEIKKEMKFDQILKDTVEEIERPINDEIRQVHNSINFEPPTRFEVPVANEVKAELEDTANEINKGLEEIQEEGSSALNAMEESTNTGLDNVASDVEAKKEN